MATKTTEEILNFDINSLEVKSSITKFYEYMNDYIASIMVKNRVVPFYYDDSLKKMYLLCDAKLWQGRYPQLMSIINTIKDVLKSDFEFEPIFAPSTKVYLVISNYFREDASSQNVVIVEESKVDNATIQEVNGIIEEAINKHASDIHFSAKGERGTVRLRINGELIDFMVRPSNEIAKMIRHLTDVSHVTTTDPVAPAHGRFTKVIKGETYDFRFASIGVYPVDTQAITAVVRILYKEERSLDDLGFEEQQKSVLLDAVNREGIIIFSGPTGSGKTTSMYALLDAAKLEGKKILTIEDPPEIVRDRFDQIEVREARSITWENALKTCLRMDPDILIIGEIRDSLAADIAIQAAITGHTVLTTIHVDRVEDIPQRFAQLAMAGESKISISTVAASISALVSQRLVKKIYKEKAKSMYLTPYYIEKLKLEGYNIVWEREEADADPFGNIYAEVLYPDPNASDLSKGYYKGYDMTKNGRTVIAEVVPKTDELRKLIESEAEASEIRKYLKELEKKTTTYEVSEGKTVLVHSHISMISHAIKKINQGIISIVDVEKYI
ncbi:MAG: ATPase, T2SS/T4P/T4SS family [Conexivisphaerales archaeon]